MYLQIPENKAIEILNKRIRELNNFNFQAQVWKDKTINDLNEIYSLGDTKWLQVNHINFDTFIESEKSKVLAQGKLQAQQLLESYIEQISEFSKIRKERTIIEDDNYKRKYSELLIEWNKLVPDYNQLLKEKDSFLEKVEFVEQDKKELKKEINRLVENTVQLSNISLIKLFKLIFNLHIGQIITFFAIIITIIGGTFKLGTLYSDSISNNVQYELRIERDKLKTENQKLKSNIEIKDLKIKSDTKIIDSLKLDIKH